MNAEVILYADKITGSMKRAIDETNRRRERQEAHNKEHGITPETIKKAIRSNLLSTVAARQTMQDAIDADETQYDRLEMIKMLEEEMLQAAEDLEFEKAAHLRDHIEQLKDSPDLRVTRPKESQNVAGRKRGSKRGTPARPRTRGGR